jgi:CheY-like chemotaxis protein
MAYILVTEDEVLVREFAREIVREAGHEPLEAAALQQALDIIASDQVVDVLFTDINLRPLPRGGLELARRAVAMRPTLHVIYTTAMELNDDMRNSLVAKAPFIPKPYTPEGLSRVLSDVLAKGCDSNKL